MFEEFWVFPGLIGTTAVNICEASNVVIANFLIYRVYTSG